MISSPIKRALLSVSDKTGIVEFASQLNQLNIEILSTGGTAELLKKHNIPTIEVSEVTQFPEMMDGRVKTLHPKIHGGILGLRDAHQEVAQKHAIDWIDLVVVNLYPFAQTIKKPGVTEAEAIENIDIGGPAMIRSGAKNHQWVSVVVNPQDYAKIATELAESKTISLDTRKQLAIKAFEHTAAYDQMIFNYLNRAAPKTDGTSLRYGENPHQQAHISPAADQYGILQATQHQGKPLSYNNIADADAALNCVMEFAEPACVIVKHANPCGVASQGSIEQAYASALQADPVSAFGGVIALNRTCGGELATKIMETFFEVIVAPGFEEAALKMFQQKANLRILQLDFAKINYSNEVRSVSGGLLIQNKDLHVITEKDLEVVTQKQPSVDEISELLFAWKVVKHIKSNAIAITKNQTTAGIGCGQVSRVGAVELALKNYQSVYKNRSQINGFVLASDAFFPFRDSIDLIKNKGISAIIQPGGSIKDSEVINACNEHNIAMVFTKTRCFKH